MSTAGPTTSRRTAKAQPPWLWPAVGIGVARLLVGVGYALTSSPADEKLPNAYGRRRGTDYAKSASGTAVLAEMYRAAGCRVTTWTRLSPKLKDCQTIVWAPDDFAPPTKEQRKFLEKWLAQGGGRRTVVYIGRDYDAASSYWSKVRPSAPPEDAAEVQRRLARAKAEYTSSRAQMPTSGYARWFTAKRDGKRRDVRSLAGPWASGIDARQCEITVQGRLDAPVAADAATSDETIPEKFEILLSSEGDTLAMRVTDAAWSGSQAIVLVNGSWVLNMPLVNHEHRKLAARLVNECDSGGKVALIESGPGGPPVLDKEPKGGGAALAFMDVWPLNAIILHLTVLGIIFCLARSPIFGRPRELPAEPAADFGKHVTALGELLARSRDQNYAQGRLQQYRELAKRGSGKSHLKGK